MAHQAAAGQGDNHMAACSQAASYQEAGNQASQAQDWQRTGRRKKPRRPEGLEGLWASRPGAWCTQCYPFRSWGYNA